MRKFESYLQSLDVFTIPSKMNKTFLDKSKVYRYIERIAMVSSGGDNLTPSSRQVVEWMNKIQDWNPKFFTLSHIPEKYLIFASKFLRLVIIARMTEAPDLASAYHLKLRDAYDTEDMLKNPQVLRRSEEHLATLLNEVEMQLNGTSYLAGEEFSLADVMLVPVLARLMVLNLEDEYINSRRNLAEYWNMVKQRPSYKKVIGRYFNGQNRYKTLLKTWLILRIRSILKRY